MFFHGMYYEYLLYQYPILSPRLTVSKQNKQQKMDRRHLIEKFGFEPVHFLESTSDYTILQCLNACFKFGDVVLAYKKLPLPVLQLSEHEVGVPVIDTRKANYLFLNDQKLKPKLKRLFPKIPIILR